MQPRAALLLAVFLAPAGLGSASQEPFKLGTFEAEGRTILGAVVRDRYVIDLKRANESLERHRPLWVSLPVPEDMNELIGRWEYAVGERVHAIVDVLLRELDSGRRPAWAHDVSSLQVQPPVRPGLILAAALNYGEHATEMTTGTPAEMSDASALDDAPVSMDHFWRRAPGDTRQNPYLFVKPSRIVIAHEQPILMKPNREQLDWECEFAVVIGSRRATFPSRALGSTFSATRS